MYLFKNAFKNTIRNKGKNILIGVIITTITICTCIGLSIHKAASNLVDTYIKKNPLEVSFQLDMSTLRNAEDSEKSSFNGLTVDDVKKYADSDLVKDYYYILETSINGENIEAVEDNERPTEENIEKPIDEENENNNFKREKMESIGDFRITAYSNFAYLKDFSSGDKKIAQGEMIDGSSEENEIVISNALAEKNNLEIGSSVILCLTNDESVQFTYQVVGIYEDNTDSSSSNFMQMSALNSSNQIYANLANVEEILNKAGTNNDTTKLVANNGLQAKFYLNHDDDLEEFEKEAKEKGLSDYYSATTNEEEILATLKPIQNLSTFASNFFIVIIVIGIIVLAVINFLNIRDRKYEIGVLRAIGMSKFKVTSQLVLEVFFVSIISLVLGTGIGTLISQPTTNKMLEKEIQSYQEETTNMEENFGRGGFERPSENMNSNFKGNMKKQNQTVDYVDSLKVKINITTILQLFAISILLTSTSAFVASLVINKYSPNKILQNR